MSQQLFKISLITLVLGVMTYGGFSQGCADAGFCTMGAMRPDQNFSKQASLKLRSAEISHYVGLTKFKNVIRAYQIDLNIGITDKYTFQAKVPYMSNTGVLGEAQGIGDLSLSLTRNIVAKEKYQINATVGMKTFLNTQDQTSADNLPLPMYYQTSLGTTDFITGISFITKKWLIATGWQKVIVGSNSANGKTANNNKFWWEPWKGHEKWTEASHYPESHWLRRRADIMLRIQRDFRFSKWSFFAGTLTIWRPRRDDWWNPSTGWWEESIGSDGMAHNFLFGGGFNINTKSAIKLSNAIRIKRRDFNPDGLSREYVNTISYLYTF